MEQTLSAEVTCPVHAVLPFLQFQRKRPLLKQSQTTKTTEEFKTEETSDIRNLNFVPNFDRLHSKIEYKN